MGIMKKILLDDRDDMSMSIYVDGKHSHDHSYKSGEAVSKWLDLINEHFNVEITVKPHKEVSDKDIILWEEYK